VVRSLIVIALVAGCYEDRYRCTDNTQCDIGEGGRCEVDGFCTKFDDSCNSGRRYQHADERGNDCFDDAVVPRNACAGGQAPAREQGCFADVCERVPACCEMAWTDACVQLAQELCTDFTCDTRIAITATRGVLTELWDLRWNGTWKIMKRVEYAQPLQWVAPPPGDTQPRLAGTTGNSALVIGELLFPTEPGRIYTSITSINFDRDRRDTIILGHTGPGGGDHRIDVLKPHDDSIRTSEVQSSIVLQWGDLDRNKFPDAVARTANQGQYHYVPSRDGEKHVRNLATGTMVNPQGGITDGSPQLRNIDWIDLDGDKQLDLIAFGSDLRIHTDSPIVENADIRVDCDPPSSDLPCTAGGLPEPNQEAMSFGGATRPTKAANELVVTTYPGRKLYRGTLQGDSVKLDRVLFPGDSCECTKSCPPPCPAAGCECTYNCAACLPIVAVIVRDLDGDHALDLIALDARLNLYHSLARTSFSEWVGPIAIPTALGNPEGFISIQTSVSGATF
jgi:hypothetical protein